MEARKRQLADCTRRRSSAVDRQSTLHTGMEPTVHLLTYELYVASIPKDALSSATHSLLEIVLKLFQEDSECRRKHFFSFTTTATEHSVILDIDLLKIIRPGISSINVKVTECKWRALVMEVGAMGSLTGVSGIVASVIGPLADFGVSVFCISTNMDDFVLVKECDLQRALTCLAKSFSIMCDSDHQLDMALVQSVRRISSGLNPPQRKKSMTRSCELPSRPITHPYFCSSSRYNVCGIVPKALPSIGTSLLQLMLFNHRSSSAETFFSLSVVEDDLTIVLDCEDLHRFPEGTLYLNDQNWRLIRIGDGPLGFDECGIVAQVSAPLAQAVIPTYYICTFHTDHTLVGEENVDVALKFLNERHETKPLKMKSNLNTIHTSLSESDLCTSTYPSTDTNLCTGSYASLTDSNLHTTTHAPFTESGIYAT